LLLKGLFKRLRKMSRPLLRVLAFGFALSCVVPGRLQAGCTVVSLPEPPRFLEPPASFYAAASNGDLEELNLDLAAGAAVDAPVPQPLPPELADLFGPHTRGAWLLREPGTTALMLATASGKIEAMNVLLAAHASREARTHSGLHPLVVAAERFDVAAMQLLLGVMPGSDAQRLSILIDLATQKATVSRDGETILTTKVSSGRKEKPTPPGRYVVTQKYTEWRSTLYHNASMPYFLRLSCSPVGLHAGVVRDTPASHGCVRLPNDIAKELFAMVPKGTIVEIR
jgi:lipoprotein-anchoring transpeptidase ErfK/SrfK